MEVTYVDRKSRRSKVFDETGILLALYANADLDRTFSEAASEYVDDTQFAGISGILLETGQPHRGHRTGGEPHSAADSDAALFGQPSFKPGLLLTDTLFRKERLLTER